jgi:hypothetical protein
MRIREMKGGESYDERSLRGCAFGRCGMVKFVVFFTSGGNES